MNIEFREGVPPINLHSSKDFLVVRCQQNQHKYVCEATYHNRNFIQMEDCTCNGQCNDEGECLVDGWYVESAHPDYDVYYSPLNGTVFLWANLPTVEEAELSVPGPW